VFLGLAVPLWIVLGSKRQSPGFLALGATLLLSSMLVMRYNFVYSGQMFSLRPLVGRMGERVSYAPPFKGNVAGFLPYTPSIVEVLVVVGALAGAIVLSVVGLRVLRLQAQAEET
jgi:Ni/Fe-hydrogenase subunit HybB-like protein